MHLPTLLGYTSLDGFLKDTQALSKHLNTPLNKLRRGVAARYGYKGIGAYESALLALASHDPDILPTYAIGRGVVLYVIIYETLQQTSHGFSYNKNKAAIGKEFAAMCEYTRSASKDGGNQVYLTRVELPFGTPEEEYSDLLADFTDRIMATHPGYCYPLSQSDYQAWVAARTVSCDDVG